MEYGPHYNPKNGLDRIAWANAIRDPDVAETTRAGIAKYRSARAAHLAEQTELMSVGEARHMSKGSEGVFVDVEKRARALENLVSMMNHDNMIKGLQKAPNGPLEDYYEGQLSGVVENAVRNMQERRGTEKKEFEKAFGVDAMLEAGYVPEEVQADFNEASRDFLGSYGDGVVASERNKMIRKVKNTANAVRAARLGYGDTVRDKRLI